MLSTIPLTALVSLLDPPPPAPVVEAATGIEFRGMILVYLVLETDRFSEYDAISRMSEPKNYSAATQPVGRTVLCAELPADPGDQWWSTPDDEFIPLMKSWLASVDLPIQCEGSRCHTRRLAHAYPVYSVGYEDRLASVDDRLRQLKGLVVFGRQGLFAHDNTHHAIAMAYAVDDCLAVDGTFDEARWARYREEFLEHTVED